MSDLYQEIILEELKHPQHQGKLEGDNVLSTHNLNASCGDEVTIYLKQEAENSPLKIKWQGTGCAISMATMSLLADKINSQQMTKQQVLQLTKSDTLDLLGLETISVGREKCLTLGLKSLQTLLE